MPGKKDRYACRKCVDKEFRGIRSAKHHAKSYHKEKDKESINQFFLDWMEKIL